MKALLLAAGLGTRLRPITNSTPKCLVEINKKPLLEYWFENLTQAGVSEFLVNTSYLSGQVEEYIKNSRFSENVSLVHEEKLLNTGGTLLANESFFNDEAFILVHADNLSFCDFKEFLKAHQDRPEKCEITMMLFKTDTPSSCGIVDLDDEGIVQEFYEKVQNPPSNLANAAVYICEPTIFSFLNSMDKKDIDFSKEVLPKLLGKIYTFLNDTYHRDIGTVESYSLAQIEILNIFNAE